jgi:GT2 family glycosyltransferase
MVEMLSLIIPTRTQEFTHQLILSLNKTQPGWQSCPDFKVYVGDNGLPTEYVRFLQSIGVKVYGVPDPFVFAKAINSGVKIADQYSDLLIMNDDAAFLSDQPLTQALMLADSARQHNFGVIGAQVATGGVGNTDQAKDVAPGSLLETDITICFICALIPRNVWNRVGSLDEAFVFYGFDDSDWSTRVKKAGYRLGVTSDIKVSHGLEGKDWHSTYGKMYDGVTLARMGKKARKVFDDKWKTHYQDTI